eukprot:g11482.t1
MLVLVANVCVSGLWKIVNMILDGRAHRQQMPFVEQQQWRIHTRWFFNWASVAAARAGMKSKSTWSTKTRDFVWKFSWIWARWHTEGAHSDRPSACKGDKVVAAIRMQVKGVPPFRRLLNIVSTLGLWLLFQPREDSASLLLTKQGRFICWGRGQEAQPGAVRAYLGQVVCFLLILFVLMLGAWSFILRMQERDLGRGRLHGATEDYTSFLDKVRIDGQLCLFKVHGCNWRVENSRLLGKVKRAEGANPPASYAEGGCTADGDYCDYFLRPTTHCSEKGEAFTNDVTAIHVRLECKVLPDLAEATKRVTYVNPYEGTGQVHTMFLIQHDLTVWSMPFDETSTNWNKVLLTQGMRIRGVALHPVELLERCIGEYRGHVDVALVETQDLVPMFKEDCQELQEACKAEGLGPETNGYWPPHRIFDHSYEKTICVYRSLKLPLWLGKAFRTDFDFLPDEVKEKLRHSGKKWPFEGWKTLDVNYLGCEVAERTRNGEETEHQRAPEVDCWEKNGSKVAPIEAGNYESYDLSNKRRTKCYIDKDPEMFFGLLFYYLILFLISWVAPENFKTFWTAVGFRPLFLIVIPCAVVLHHYIELPTMQSPPPSKYLHWGIESFAEEKDSFKIGRISWAQLDMPAKPLLEDRLRSGFSEAWRRGSVTLRGFRGLLQVSREHGEALEMYTAFTSLSESRPPIAKLGAVGSGGHSIAGLMEVREAHLSGDPFNYSTLLTLTDRRILVTRARWPKALSLVGCLIGPRTCSHHCSILQERWGYFPYITLTSESLESYVTQRVRAPPFWPGFMKPIMSLSVNFLEKWMKSYPSALQVTQRPYGIPREVHVPRGAKIWLRSVEGEDRGDLRDGSAPRGQYVEEVWEGGEELDLNDSFWVKGALAPEDAKLVLQAGDPEWDGYADEPWLHQMREILDHISGRTSRDQCD